MSTININHVFDENKKLAGIINELGELLLRENMKLYEQVISIFFLIDKTDPKEEKEFLLKLYIGIIDKLKIIEYELSE